MSGLKIIPIKRATRSPGEPRQSVWTPDQGRAVSRDATWCVVRLHEIDRAWSFIHVPTGLQAGGLYAMTMKGAEPVLRAIDGVGRDIRAEKPGDAGTPEQMAAMRQGLVDALRAADVSGLDAGPLARFLGRPAPAQHAAAPASAHRSNDPPRDTPNPSHQGEGE